MKIRRKTSRRLKLFINFLTIKKGQIVKGLPELKLQKGPREVHGRGTTTSKNVTWLLCIETEIAAIRKKSVELNNARRIKFGASKNRNGRKKNPDKNMEDLRNNVFKRFRNFKNEPSKGGKKIVSFKELENIRYIH